MKFTTRIFSVLALAAILAVTVVTPAAAFDGRSGDRVVVNEGEVIEDDLYVTAEEFVLDGTVTGDLVVFARVVTVNGSVGGDLIAAAQAVIINGDVADDVRIAGAGLQVGENATIGGDLVAAGASLENKAGSSVGGDVVWGGGQVLLAGDVTQDVLAGTGGLELRGSVGGDVQAFVDVTDETESAPPMNMYMTNMPISIPSLQPGLTIAEGASIKGNLEYTSTIDLDFPEGAVGGKVTRILPRVSEQTGTVTVETSAAEKVGLWVLDMLRTMITLILFGLLLGWLFPSFMKALPEQLTANPWRSLGWGAIAWAAFFFLLFAIVLAMIFGGLLFGFLTLGGVSGTIVWLGILGLIGCTILFVLITSYLTKIIVGDTIGKWILGRTGPALAGHRFWPMIIGVVVLVFVIEMFRFPFLPIGFFGWLINFAVILFGLGSLWLWGRERFAKKPAVVAQ